MAKIHLSILHVQSGDNEYTFDDVNDEDRAKLGDLVNDLVQKGALVTIQFYNNTAALVKGYDPTTNTFAIKDGAEVKQISASDTKLTAAPRTAGG